MPTTLSKLSNMSNLSNWKIERLIQLKKPTPVGSLKNVYVWSFWCLFFNLSIKSSVKMSYSDRKSVILSYSDRCSTMLKKVEDIDAVRNSRRSLKMLEMFEDEDVRSQLCPTLAPPFAVPLCSQWGILWSQKGFVGKSWTVFEFSRIQLEFVNINWNCSKPIEAC